MSKYRNNLPQLKEEKLCLVDGGLETYLYFHKGIDLPVFGSFTLLKTDEGTETLKNYFERFAQLAADYKVNFMLETPTWRASRDWGAKCGFDVDAIESINKKAVSMSAEIRREMENLPETKIILVGKIGPRGDGFFPDKSNLMTSEEAKDYHSQQINWLAASEIDMILFLTANYSAEAIGAVRAAQAAGIQIAVSFTLETDGNLPIGQSLKDAIIQIDEETNQGPIYYMINCAHPTHFNFLFDEPETWQGRIRGFQPNASRRSHSELAKRTSLDEGDEVEFGKLVSDLKLKLPAVNILGGCCGTYLGHIESICRNVCQKQ